MCFLFSMASFHEEEEEEEEEEEADIHLRREQKEKKRFRSAYTEQQDIVVGPSPPCQSDNLVSAELCCLGMQWDSLASRPHFRPPWGKAEGGFRRRKRRDGREIPTRSVGTNGFFLPYLPVSGNGQREMLLLLSLSLFSFCKANFFADRTTKKGNGKEEQSASLPSPPSPSPPNEISRNVGGKGKREGGCCCKKEGPRKWKQQQRRRREEGGRHLGSPFRKEAKEEKGACVFSPFLLLY